MSTIDLPSFKITETNHMFYFIKLVKDSLLCWEQVETHRLQSKIFPVIEIPKEILENLQVWEKLSSDIQKSIIEKNRTSIPETKLSVAPASVKVTTPQPTSIPLPQCSHCLGKGYIHVALSGIATGPEAQEEPPTEPCPNCNGTGHEKRKRGRPRKNPLPSNVAEDCPKREEERIIKCSE